MHSLRSGHHRDRAGPGESLSEPRDPTGPGYRALDERVPDVADAASNAGNEPLAHDPFGSYGDSGRAACADLRYQTQRGSTMAQEPSLDEEQPVRSPRRAEAGFAGLREAAQHGDPDLRGEEQEAAPDLPGRCDEDADDEGQPQEAPEQVRVRSLLWIGLRTTTVAYPGHSRIGEGAWLAQARGRLPPEAQGEWYALVVAGFLMRGVQGHGGGGFPDYLPRRQGLHVLWANSFILLAGSCPVVLLVPRKALLGAQLLTLCAALPSVVLGFARLVWMVD